MRTLRELALLYQEVIGELPRTVAELASKYDAISIAKQVYGHKFDLLNCFLLRKVEKRPDADALLARALQDGSTQPVSPERRTR